jgi:predicted PurR-regulated permease PerM
MPTEFARADTGRRERSSNLPAASTSAWAFRLMVGAFAFVGISWLLGQVLLVLGAGALAAVALSAATNRVMELGVRRRSLALALVVAGLVLVVGATSWLLAPEISAQTDQLLQQLPHAWQNVLESLRRSEWGRALARPPQAPQVEESLAVVSNATGVFAIVLHNVGMLMIAAFVGLYLAADPGPYCTGIIRLLPPSRRRRAAEVAQVVEQALERWLLSRLVAMVIVGSVTALGLWLLNVHLALTLGLFSGLLTFIPYIGAVVSLLPALLLAFTQGSLAALYVLLLYIAVHMLEGYLVTPLIEQKAVQLPPGLSIAAQLVFWTLAGPWGLALASPIAATVLIAVNMLYIEDELDETPAIPTEVGK